MMNFEIFCYGDGDFLTHIFNAVAAMTGHGDFRFAMMLVVSYVFLTMLLMAMLRGQLLDLRWFFGILLIYSLCLVPKVNVSIEDRLQGGWGGMPVVHVVGQVPIGLAFISSVSSKLGDWLTSTMETVFSLPGGLNYLDNGPLFAGSIVQAMTAYQVLNPNTATSLNNFWHNCVFYDLELGFYGMQSLADAPDLEVFFNENSAANRGFDDIDMQGTHQIVDCNAAFAGHLDLDLQTEVAQAENYLPFQHQAAVTNQMISGAASAMPIAFQYLSGLSLAASQTLTQAALINSFPQGLGSFASSANASTAMMGYAQAQAEQQRSIDYGVLSKISAQTLPVMRDLFEAFIDALFPVVALMSMLPGGHRALLSYFRAQLWVALWPPIYAVLNFAVTFFTAVAAQKTLQVCAQGYACMPSYTLATLPGFKASLQLHATLAGFLMTSIPMIAWLVVNQSGAMMASLAGRVMDGYAQPVSHASQSVAQGNISQGELHLDNFQAWNQMSAPHNQQGFLENDDGRFRVEQTSQGPLAEQHMSSLAVGTSIINTLQNTYEKDLSKANQEQNLKEWASLHSQGQLYNRVQEEMKQKGVRDDVGLRHDHQDGSDHDILSRNIDQAVNQYASSHAQNAVHGNTVKAMLAMTGKMPFFGDLVHFQGNLSSTLTMQHMTEDQKRWVMDYLHSAEHGEAMTRSIRELDQTSKDHVTTEQHTLDKRTEQAYQLAQRDEQSYRHAQETVQRLSESLKYLSSQRMDERQDMANALLERLQGVSFDWKQGLEDLSRAHDTQEAKSVRRVMDDLLQQIAPQQPEALVQPVVTEKI